MAKVVVSPAATSKKAKAPAGESGKSFVRQLLDIINSVRASPVSIVAAIQEQMSHVDEENVLSVPGRVPIQLEEGKKAVSNAPSPNCKRGQLDEF